MNYSNEELPELYDAEAERNSMWCDGCGAYHGGACQPYRDDEDESGDDE